MIIICESFIAPVGFSLLEFSMQVGVSYLCYFGICSNDCLDLIVTPQVCKPVIEKVWQIKSAYELVGTGGQNRRMEDYSYSNKLTTNIYRY